MAACLCAYCLLVLAVGMRSCFTHGTRGRCAAVCVRSSGARKTITRLDRGCLWIVSALIASLASGFFGFVLVGPSGTCRFCVADAAGAFGAVLAPILAADKFPHVAKNACTG